jgi:hypothetical protein
MLLLIFQMTKDRIDRQGGIWHPVVYGYYAWLSIESDDIEALFHFEERSVCSRYAAPERDAAQAHFVRNIKKDGEVRLENEISCWGFCDDTTGPRIRQHRGDILVADYWAATQNDTDLFRCLGDSSIIVEMAR